MTKCRAVIKQNYMDDIELDEEGVAEMLMDENALASVPRYALRSIELLHCNNPVSFWVKICVYYCDFTFCLKSWHLLEHPTVCWKNWQLRSCRQTSVILRQTSDRLCPAFEFAPHEWHWQCKRRSAEQPKVWNCPPNDNTGPGSASRHGLFVFEFRGAG